MEKIRSFTSQKTYVESLATSLRSRISKKAYEGKTFRLALSGGSTPRPLYEFLASLPDVDWRSVEIFLVDERYVPLADENSNCKMIREALVDHVQLKKFVHFDTSLKIEESLSDYEQHLNHQDHFFDLLVLGIGSDGHTASLFPGDSLLQEKKRWVGHSTNGDPISDRLTLAYSALESTRESWFLITGDEKLKVVESALQTASKYPASRLLRSDQSKVFHGDF